jgi:hypothetical protein
MLSDVVRPKPRLPHAGGGYEGDEAVAQRLKAHREGTIAAVKFWEEKFNQDGAETPNADELLALAKKLKDAEFPQAFSSSCSVTPTPECMCQQGKLEVDTFIANNMDRQLKAYGPERAEQDMVQSLGNWQKKIDKISLSQNWRIAPGIVEPPSIYHFGRR